MIKLIYPFAITQANLLGLFIQKAPEMTFEEAAKLDNLGKKAYRTRQPMIEIANRIAAADGYSYLQLHNDEGINLDRASKAALNSGHYDLAFECSSRALDIYESLRQDENSDFARSRKDRSENVLELLGRVKPDTSHDWYGNYSP
jgi:hypothetical protein